MTLDNHQNCDNGKHLCALKCGTSNFQIRTIFHSKKTSEQISAIIRIKSKNCEKATTLFSEPDRPWWSCMIYMPKSIETCYTSSRFVLCPWLYILSKTLLTPPWRFETSESMPHPCFASLHCVSDWSSHNFSREKTSAWIFFGIHPA